MTSSRRARGTAETKSGESRHESAPMQVGLMVAFSDEFTTWS